MNNCNLQSVFANSIDSKTKSGLSKLFDNVTSDMSKKAEFRDSNAMHCPKCGRIVGLSKLKYDTCPCCHEDLTSCLLRK